MGLVQVEPFSGTRNRNPMSEIEEVKQRADIIEIVSRYTPLKRAGATYKGLCPFHTERTPSFVVFPQTGTWRCFGACGTGGDVFSFLMQRFFYFCAEAVQNLCSAIKTSAGNNFI